LGRKIFTTDTARARSAGDIWKTRKRIKPQKEIHHREEDFEPQRSNTCPGRTPALAGGARECRGDRKGRRGRRKKRGDGGKKLDKRRARNHGVHGV
jgi:hypothetical protein